MMKPKKCKHSKSESGQSTIEFVLSMVFLLSFILFFFQLSFVFAFGNYAHYATFMAARALQSAGGTPEDQTERAKSVIIQTLKLSEGFAGVDRYPSLAKGIGGSQDLRGADIGEFRGTKEEFQFDYTDKSKSWLEGVRYTFRSKLFLMALKPADTAASGPGSVDNEGGFQLTSESFLSRDPSYQECTTFMGTVAGEFDNGC